MALADQATLAKDTAFRDRVWIAVVSAAKDVQGEAKGEMSDQKFAKRQVLSSLVLSPGGMTLLDTFAWAVAANPAVDANADDNAILFTVAQVWDDLAGVRSTD